MIIAPHDPAPSLALEQCMPPASKWIQRAMPHACILTATSHHPHFFPSLPTQCSDQIHMAHNASPPPPPTSTLCTLAVGPSLQRLTTYSKMDGNIRSSGLALGGVITQGLKQVSRASTDINRHPISDTDLHLVAGCLTT